MQIDHTCIFQIHCIIICINLATLCWIVIIIQDTLCCRIQKVCNLLDEHRYYIEPCCIDTWWCYMMTEFSICFGEIMFIKPPSFTQAAYRILVAARVRGFNLCWHFVYSAVNDIDWVHIYTKFIYKAFYS